MLSHTASSEQSTLTTSSQPVTPTLSQTPLSVAVQAVATSGESVTGLMSPLVTASAMLVTSRPTLTTAASDDIGPQPASSCPSLTTSMCPPLTTTSCVLMAPTASTVSMTCAVDTPQTLSAVVEPATSHGEAVVGSAPRTSTDDRHVIENMALRQVKEADLTANTDLVSCAADTKDSSGVLSEQTADTGLMANAKKTFTSTSERQQTSSQQQQEHLTVDDNVAEDDGHVEKMSSSKQLEHEPSTSDHDDDKAPVSSRPTAAAACSDVSDMVNSKSDSAETHKDSVGDGMSEEQEAQESLTALSSRKDDEKNKDAGSEEMRVDEVNETVARKNDDVDECCERTGMVSEARDNAGDTETESSVREQQCRQVMTLPADILSHVSMSQPISLTLSHQQQQLTVPATNIYQSSSGLRLLLPPDSLPDEYVGNKLLAFTLGRSGDTTQSQMITVHAQ